MRAGASRGAVRLARHDGRVSDEEKRGEAPPVLRHIDLPVTEGAKLTLFTPIDSAFLSHHQQQLGRGFTVDIAGDRWRVAVETLSAKKKGTLIELRIEGRYRADIDGMNGRERT